MSANKSISRMFSTSMIFVAILALTFSALGVAPALAAGTRFVTPGGAGDCASWATACDLQTALTGAASGDEIWVAAGAYKPTNGTDRAATFQLKDGVALYGGFSGAETAREQRNFTTNVTILSGDLNGNDNSNVAYDEPTRADNSYAVVTGANNATLDGFAITAGNGNEGGGMSNSSSSPTVTNVIFSNNSAREGGGMSNSSSNPTLTNVTFSGNSAEDYGGGMYNFDHSNSTLANVTFSANSAMNGGGLANRLSDPTLTNITFSGNSVTRFGGGMYNAGMYSGDRPILTNVTFRGNSAAWNGGGMFNDEGGQPVLTNVTFSGNSATRSGGGMTTGDHSSATLTYVTFKDNSAGTGGGIDNRWYGDLQVSNAIFWGNTATYYDAQINRGDGTGTTSVSNSVVQGGCPNGISCTNIITADPMLGTLGDYGGLTQTIPLLTGSSAIDTGNDATCPATDQRGITRPQGAYCDIGAYESNAVTFTSIDTQDGWVLASSANSAAATFRIGDNAAKKPYRSILSFSTGSLPDNAVITSVTLKVKKSAIVGGGNPVTAFGGFMVDIKKGFFGAATLQVSDFQAAASKSYGPFNTALVGGWYSINLTTGKAYINKLATSSGLTQIRLRFKSDNNNNALANYLSLYSGNAPMASRPRLVITYIVP
jgi:predicted outer membrane repeat protein